MSGLVIDDFFCLSAEKISGARGEHFPNDNRSRACLRLAKEAYDREGILGSDDKEVSDALRYKVIGAEVNSKESLAKHGFRCFSIGGL